MQGSCIRCQVEQYYTSKVSMSDGDNSSIKIQILKKSHQSVIKTTPWTRISYFSQKVPPSIELSPDCMFAKVQ